VFFFSALEILALNIMEPILLAGEVHLRLLFLEEERQYFVSPKWNSLALW
jgi:hypothetical protein